MKNSALLKSVDLMRGCDHRLCYYFPTSPDPMHLFFPGDEVVEWNGRSLRGLTFEDVYDIIFESKSDPQVELKVERPVSRTDLNAVMSEQHEIEGFRLSFHVCNFIKNVHVYSIGWSVHRH